MIELTAKQIEHAQKMLGHIPGAAQKAVAHAINRATQTAKSAAATEARKSYVIKHGDVLKTISIRKASPGDLTAAVVSRGHVVALPKFRVTPKAPQPKRAAEVRWKKGRTFSIKARVKHGDGGGSINNAFVARMKSGHVGVFNRSSGKRFPIIQRFGPSVPQMLGAPSVRLWVENRATEALDKRLDHEIKRILQGSVEK